MTILGKQGFQYKADGSDWGELPEGWTYREATAVAVNSKDQVYVFNRGGHPIIIFDSEGKFLDSWGEDAFVMPHGIAIGPDDSVNCADVGESTIKKFTPEGKLLMKIESENGRVEPMSGNPFCRPCHVAINPRNGDLYVAAIAKGDFDFRTTVRVNETGFAAGTQTVITLDTRVATPNFAPGDIIHAVDDAVLGTIKTVDSATQITLTTANVDAIGDSDPLSNISPIQLILGGTV